MSNIFIVIPAYNEENSIQKVINDVRQTGNDYNMVVVDDNSSDSTYEKANKAGAITLRHIINRGQGAALKTGTEYAIIKGADIIVHFDADGQFVASEIKDVITPIINREADVVFGSRFLGKNSNMPFLKRKVFLPLARLVHKFFKVKMTNPQSGFRAFSKNSFAKLNWQQDRMAHCSEIIFNAFNSNLKIKEVPTTVIYHHFGQKFSGGLKIIKDMFLGSLTRNS